MRYDDRHGGPYDRGRADFYYRQRFDPHYYRGDSFSSPRVDMADMTSAEIVAYTAGFRDAELVGETKDWGAATCLS